jgi:hypothetical protein
MATEGAYTWRMHLAPYIGSAQLCGKRMDRRRTSTNSRISPSDPLPVDLDSTLVTLQLGISNMKIIILLDVGLKSLN